ncbi:MAG TPA: outer membrane protein transport protein [Opitutaceae bacterium]|nr:outer membrane protein transport protein [Opitutaceae bacterium]
MHPSSPATDSPFRAPRPSRRGARAALVLLLALAPPLLVASGTQIGFKDAFATARGNAFVATADNPSAIYYNPAGLTQLSGQNLSATAYAIQLNADFQSAYSAAATSSLKKETKLLPQAYYAYAPAGSRWAAGVGVYAPFGLSTDWNNANQPFTNPLFPYATKNTETYTTINPVFAWRVSDTVSLGGGLTFNHLKVDLNRGVLYFGIPYYGNFRFNADGNDVGYNLGLRWQPATEHAFGLSYQARTTFGVSGSTTLLNLPITPGGTPTSTVQSAQADFAFPEVLIAGYSYRPNPDWNFEADIDWTNWNCLKTVTITQPSGPVALPFNWKASCFYELGVTRQLGDGWTVSAGYTYSQNSVPDATFNPAVPDADRHFLNAGVGYAQGPVRIALTLQRALAGTRHVNSGQPVALVPYSVDGAYKTSIDALALSVDCHF